MSTFLSDKTADVLLCGLPEVRKQLRRVDNSAFFGSRDGDPSLSLLEAMGDIQKPYDVLVHSNVGRTPSRKVRHHSFTRLLPPGSFLRVRDDLHVCCPELVFVQMAKYLSFPALVALGYEYCGTYGIDSRTGSSRYGVVSLTSAARLRDYIDAMPAVRGIENARKAAKLISDDSASPMETALHMTLCLSGAHGGYGLPKAAMNHRIDLSEGAQKVYQRRYCKCDLLFEGARLDLEYHGEEFHHAKRDDDSARAYALEIMGCRSLAVSRSQFNDTNALAQIAKEIAKAYGKYKRAESLKWTSSRERLRSGLREYLQCEGRANVD